MENQIVYDLGSTIKLKCMVKNIIIVIFIKIIMMIINIRWRTSWGSSRSTSSGRRATGCSTMTRREEASGVLLLLLIFLSINFHFSALSLYLYLVPTCLCLCLRLSLDILFQRANRPSSQRSSKPAAHRRYLLIINISSSKYQYHLPQFGQLGPLFSEVSVEHFLASCKAFYEVAQPIPTQNGQCPNTWTAFQKGDYLTLTMILTKLAVTVRLTVKKII